jgi:hypothetical protein
MKTTFLIKTIIGFNVNDVMKSGYFCDSLSNQYINYIKIINSLLK